MIVGNAKLKLYKVYIKYFRAGGKARAKNSVNFIPTLNYYYLVGHQIDGHNL